MARRDMGLGESLPSSWKIRYEEIAPGVFVRMVTVHPIDDISGFSGFISVGRNTASQLLDCRGHGWQRIRWVSGNSLGCRVGSGHGEEVHDSGD